MKIKPSDSKELLGFFFCFPLKGQWQKRTILILSANAPSSIAFRNNSNTTRHERNLTTKPLEFFKIFLCRYSDFLLH